MNTIIKLAVVCVTLAVVQGCSDIHPDCKSLYPSICGTARELCSKTCGDCQGASVNFGCQDSLSKTLCKSLVESKACGQPNAQALCSKSCGAC